MFYLVLALSTYFVWVWRLKRSPSEPPVLSGWLPIFGHGLQALGSTLDKYNAIHRISEESQAKGGVIRAYFGPFMMYGITDVDDALTISNACLEKYFIYNFGRMLLKNGLLTADVHTWKKNRKLLNPAFTSQVVGSLLDTFNNQARKLVDEFDKETGKPFDHDEVVRLNNLETICMSAFGANASEFGKLQEQYLPHWDAAVTLIDQRFQKPWYMSDYIYNLSRLKKNIDAHVEKLSKLANTIIQKKIYAMKNAAFVGEEGDQLNPFIRTILKSAEEGNFTDEDIRGEIDTIIAAGHDTTASTVAFALTLLGSHPDEQEKAHQEILQVIGDSDRDIDKEDLSQLPYIEAVVKETLRLYPIVPVIIRQINEDVQIKNYTLKANRGCFISLHGILRAAAWGADRHQFNPRRWLHKDTLPDHKYYAAFSLGRRFCIGKTYAMMSMKTTLAHILRRYKITSDVSRMIVSATFVTKPAGGHHIVVEKRSQ